MCDTFLCIAECVCVFVFSITFICLILFACVLIYVCVSMCSVKLRRTCAVASPFSIWDPRPVQQVWLEDRLLLFFFKHLSPHLSLAILSLDRSLLHIPLVPRHARCECDHKEDFSVHPQRLHARPPQIYPAPDLKVWSSGFQFSKNA